MKTSRRIKNSYFPHYQRCCNFYHGFVAIILDHGIYPSSASHISPAVWARELFKPSKKTTSLVDLIKKFWSVFDFFFVGDVTKKEVLVFLAHLTGPWPPTQWAKFLTQVFNGTRLESESLEPTIDYLARLIDYLWVKGYNQKS